MILRRMMIIIGAAPLAACVADSPSPFGAGGEGVTIGAATSTASGGDGGGEPSDDPELGGPCTDGAQCDDGADCTNDACDPLLGRCRFSPDDAVCDNGVYCDGAEACAPRIGCEGSTPVDCGDDDACTIDTCEESTRTCSRAPRDGDGDGDPDDHCDGGGDCDDTDPTRSSLVPEVCDDARDDDCDGEIDEGDCVAPAHDDCESALELDGPGAVVLSVAGALDAPVSCATEGMVSDAFALVTIPDGPDRDLDVRVRGDLGDVAVAIQESCGEPATEIACGQPARNPSSDPVARAIARSASPGTYAVVVTTSAPQPLTLDVRILPGTSAPENETCGTADDVAIGTVVPVTIVDAVQDVGTACARQSGDLVYRFELEEQADVDVFAESVDGWGLPSLSFRTEACALPEDELVCSTEPFAHLYRGALEAGEHFIAVSATAPTDATFTIATSPPTPRPEDETCDGAPTVAPGETVTVSYAFHQDDHHPCGTGAVDAAYELDLGGPSDVLLVDWAGQGDEASLALTGPACGEGDLVMCAQTGTVPVRLRKRGLAAGSWFALVESTLGTEQRLDVLARPASPAIAVPFADACGAAQSIPAGGGFFTGNTTSAAADFEAGCDDAGGEDGGAPDRLLRLDLDEPARVVFDMSGTTYDALLDVRRGPDCPGVEVPFGCTVASGGAGAPYLDLELEAGSYFVQIDGRGGSAGAFQLDVFIVR